jgi:serine/threonine-protein kinase
VAVGGAIEDLSIAPSPVGDAPASPLPSGPPGYELLGELGRGGMGVVYKAHDVRIGRIVALKVIRSGEHAGQEELARFIEEVKAVAVLTHQNVVHVHNFGTHEGVPYFVMEYCPGDSLATRLARGPLAPREAARLVEQLAEAVQAAHESGIVHRDLKPSNILFAEGGQPKVSDFGLARRQSGAGLTYTGAVIGTPSYMAPEQATGSKEIGPPSDVYSLGAILYECLTGRPPLQGGSIQQTLDQVIRATPTSPRQLNPAVPRDLEIITLKCLEKEPVRRYPSALALAQDLYRFANREQIKARPAGRLERAWKWVRRNPTMAALIAVSVVATAALGALAALVLSR